MMFSRPQLSLLSTLAVLFAVTQANWLDKNLFYKRQNTDFSSSGALLGTSSDPGSSSSPSSAAASLTPASVSATSTPPSSSTPPSTFTPSSSTTATSSPPSTTLSPSSSQITLSTSKDDSISSRVLTTSVSVSVHVATKVTIITSDGSVYSSTMVSSSTSTTSSTGVAELNKSDSSGSSGMSSSTTKTIIGVCVGIGGAAILGALAFVFFRLRKSRQGREEDDGLMGYRTGVGSANEKSSAASPPSQFQATLDNYHAPPRNANLSSNF